MAICIVTVVVGEAEKLLSDLDSAEAAVICIQLVIHSHSRCSQRSNETSVSVQSS